MEQLSGNNQGDGDGKLAVSQGAAKRRWLAALRRKGGLIFMIAIGAWSFIFGLGFKKMYYKQGVPWSKVLPENVKDLPASAELNAYIQEVAATYPMNQTYPAVEASKVAKNMGFTQDMYYAGKLIAKGNEDKSSHCSGLTLEVFLRAYEKINGFPYYTTLKFGGSNDYDKFEDFRKLFYGVGGNKRTVADALPQYGLGMELTNLNDAKPGDLVQLWRHNKTGHCAVFQQWLFNGKGERIGIQCFQVSRSTSGIAIRNEFFGDSGDAVISSEIFVVRPVIRRD